MGVARGGGSMAPWSTGNYCTVLEVKPSYLLV